MPQHESTYAELYARQLNIAKFAHEYWAISDVFDPLRKSVQRYEQFNQMHLKHLLSKQTELYEKYVERDEQGFLFQEHSILKIEGKPERKYKNTGVDGREPKFISSEAEEAFYKEWEELLDTKCTITT